MYSRKLNVRFSFSVFIFLCLERVLLNNVILSWLTECLIAMCRLKSNVIFGKMLFRKSVILAKFLLAKCCAALHLHITIYQILCCYISITCSLLSVLLHIMSGYFVDIAQ